MLYSTILRLKALREVAVPAAAGYQAYAMTLNLLAGSSPALADALHGDASVKPITVSPLQGGFPRKSGDIHLQEGTPCWIRITCLDDATFCALADAVLRLLPEHTLDLAGCPVAVQSLDTVPGGDPLVDCTTFEALLDDARPEAEFVLAFLSPTVFRSKGRRNVLFPEPQLAFGSLLARWNALAAHKLSLTPEQLPSLLRMGAYRLSTRLLNFGGYQESGFTGRCAYRVTDGQGQEEARLLNALASFALFSGVGAKTTMGMGQCRRSTNASPLFDGARGR